MDFFKHLPLTLKIIFFICISIIATSLITYIIQFNNRPFGNTEEFGQFGDYIGGLANPILSFFTILLLLWSIKIQTDEMKRSADATEEQIRLLKSEKVKNELEASYYRNLEKCHTLINEQKILLDENYFSITEIIDKPELLKKYIATNKNNQSPEDTPQKINSNFHLLITKQHMTMLLQLGLELVNVFDNYVSASVILANTETTLAYGYKFYLLDENDHYIKTASTKLEEITNNLLKSTN